MRTKLLYGTLVVATGMAMGATASHADDRAKLDGIQEVPSVSSDATGSFRASLKRYGPEVKYKLSYAGTESSLKFAHVHFGERHENGRIIAFLCDNENKAPPGTPYCPPGSGTVQGTTAPDDVLGPAAQGIAPGDLNALVDAINARAAYINVHSEKFPTGELRGQVRGRVFGLSYGDHDGDESDD